MPSVTTLPDAWGSLLRPSSPVPASLLLVGISRGRSDHQPLHRPLLFGEGAQRHSAAPDVERKPTQHSPDRAPGTPPSPRLHPSARREAAGSSPSPLPCSSGRWPRVPSSCWASRCAWRPGPGQEAGRKRVPCQAGATARTLSSEAHPWSWLWDHRPCNPWSPRTSIMGCRTGHAGTRTRDQARF